VIDLLVTTLWFTTMEKWIRANSNHRRSMKAETSRQIPQKLAANLELILLNEHYATYMKIDR